jgi:hypothetical protein
VAVWVRLLELDRVPNTLDLETPDGCPPDIELVKLGAFQVNKVPCGTIPLVPLVGVTLKVSPLQITAVMVVITAFGSTVINTVKVAPTQDPSVAVGVTI